MVKYNIYNKGNEELFQKISNRYGIDPVISRVLVNRDVAYEDIEEYLNPSLKCLNSPHLLKDVDIAADLILQAANDDKKIRIIGDYDVDGVESTYILLEAIEQIGGNVDYTIPHRVEDGYGINNRIIRKAYEDHVNVIVTCDNGISAAEEIQLAKDFGMKVIVTDHHDVPYKTVNGEKVEELPRADAIVNPKRKDDTYPFKNICGAAVAWKLVQVMYEKCYIDHAMNFIENVAVATICDVMDLVGENRTIVKLGLQSLNRTRNIGMKSLIRAQNIQGEINAYHIGFVLGPCMNASGRLDSAVKALELLRTRSEIHADKIAKELMSLNEERKRLTEEAKNKAFEIIESNYSNDKVLIVFLPDIHESIAGIVAGKVREKYNKPTIILSKSDIGVKGSGRSIEEYNMYEALSECKDLLDKFGGHPMAAGLLMDYFSVGDLRERLNENAKLTEEDFVEKCTIDVTINLEYLNNNLIKQLKMLEPFGNGNKKPVFAVKNASIVNMKKIGAGGRCFKLLVQCQGCNITGLYFKDAVELEKRLVEKYGFAKIESLKHGKQEGVTGTLIYYPQINEYNGYRSIQIVITDVIV